MYFQQRAARQRAVLAESRQEILRAEADTRAYAADMNTAACTTAAHGSLGSVAHLLLPWPTWEPDLRGWEVVTLKAFGIPQPPLRPTVQTCRNASRGVQTASGWP